ncbi:MAG: hypothetical protein KJ970_08830 [Candidatus Eisenbacteria bacterium]|uniref:Uncharacterized protein n=1 Tax=Eiseniibacteriota bacterium TaxID=2212470 RepID=A0A948RW20_UNCEI|nr:hypothetical protein [Candidatus Eisenbacteria bacterium]MBU1950750.1 hypothetical protein [Candidatus Eisenbacteria bacterium]MBU2691021.1 hypothetical protein [Candidatus Eisenbacteria bacterium]
MSPRSLQVRKKIALDSIGSGIPGLLLAVLFLANSALAPFYLHHSEDHQKISARCPGEQVAGRHSDQCEHLDTQCTLNCCSALLHHYFNSILGPLPGPSSFLDAIRTEGFIGDLPKVRSTPVVYSDKHLSPKDSPLALKLRAPPHI